MVDFKFWKKNIEKELSSMEKLGIQFQQKVDFATRQEFRIEYNQTMRNPGLSVDYRIQYADDDFDIDSAPWLRSMDSVFGERVCRCITMIHAGWERYRAQKEAYGGTFAKVNIWEPYVVGSEIQEKAFVREVDAETALNAAKVLKRRDGKTPKAEILEVYERAPLGKLPASSEKMKRKLGWAQNYIGKTEILPCYKYANRVAWGAQDVGADTPIVVQSVQAKEGGGGMGLSGAADFTGMTAPPGGQAIGGKIARE